ncbi:DUF7133 domain-containing protein [Siphonobacter aquaeclarae]|nr:c-type cytochrome [Siphonobacter aquaeclarae]
MKDDDVFLPAYPSVDRDGQAASRSGSAPGPAMVPPLYLFIVHLRIAFLGLLLTALWQFFPKTDARVAVPASDTPFVPASESIRHMAVEDGFEVQLVAAEPLVSAPVALSFDGKGRLWVVEMNGYMNDTLGTGEERPSGKIVILEDSDKDGVADKRKVFLDSLVLPRAICFVGKGILVAEPPSLWYYEVVNDKPVKKTLVDGAYAKGGNVEHQPNGLYRALDNWIYNAKSDKRYRFVKGKWISEKTHFRGQWGISQDDNGRLYYNHNSQNAIGDYFLPGFGSENTHQRNQVAGFNVNVVEDNRVYPAGPTPGVNRGYAKGTLDNQQRLVQFTAACGPLVYRGGLFGKEYDRNVFVAEPSANLIKRNVLTFNGYVTSGKQAYAGKEFLTSTDERFRPVSLYDAPDGALYVVDMYRGIIQHKTYLTTYLKGQIAKRGLTQPLTAGRIYRIVPKGTKPVVQPVTADVRFLASTNGWVRDFAQQKLVDAGKPVAALRPLLTSTSELQRIHAFRTLEGLGLLTVTDITSALKSPSWSYREQALGAVPSVLTKAAAPVLAKALDGLLVRRDTLSYPYIAFLSGKIAVFDAAAAAKLRSNVLKAAPQNRYVAAAVVSTLEDREESFLDEQTDSTALIIRDLKSAVRNARSARGNHDPAVLARQYPKGAALFNTICQTCHGKDGNGVQSLAPPLNKSEWVTGDKNHLISIVLFGLTGPVNVNNHLYSAPEIAGDMPGIGYDPSLSDKDIAELLSYIRRSWQNNADRISPAEVSQVRKNLGKRDKAFTIKELTGQ